MFGFSARSMGQGGGGLALVSDGTAAYVNPAGLSRIRQPTAAIGVSAAFEQFKALPPVWWDTNRDGVVDERDDPLVVPADVDDPIGLQVSVGRNIGGKFGLGLTLYIPTRRLIRFSTFEPSLPTYFMYENRPQRYVAAAGLGGEIVKGVHLGVAVDFVPRANSRLSTTFRGDIHPPDGTDESGDVVGEIVVDTHEITLDLVPDFAPILGLQLEFGKWAQALDGLVFAAMWRGAVGLPIDVDVDVAANVSLEDIGDLESYVVAGILKGELLLYDHYVPSTLGLGLAYRRNTAWSAYVDVRWTDWRGMLINVAQLTSAEVTSPLIDLNDALVDGNDFDLELRSVWNVRLGTEIRVGHWELNNRFRYLTMNVRMGFGHDPTPLKSQGSTSAFLDSHRTMFTVGAGIETFDPLELLQGPVRLDTFFQFHRLAPYRLEHASNEPQAGFPVQSSGFPIGGHLLVTGIQWSFDYK